MSYSERQLGSKIDIRSENQPAFAARSVDRVRVIRRSMRCCLFGAIGLVPILGVGLAWQALRLRHAIEADLQEPRQVPAASWDWLLGFIPLYAADQAWGLLAALNIGIILLAVQSWRVWRRLRPGRRSSWNPAQLQLALGVIFARTGLSASFWSVALLLSRIAKASVSA